jgi:hypothetical protein
MADELTASASFVLIFGLLSELVCVERSSVGDNVAVATRLAGSAGTAPVLGIHRLAALGAPHQALFRVRFLNPPKRAFFFG